MLNHPLAKRILKLSTWVIAGLITGQLLLVYGGSYGLKRYLRGLDIEVGQVNLGIRQTTLHQVTFKHGSIERMALAYNPFSLIDQHLKSVNIEGLMLTINLDESGQGQGFEELSPPQVRIDEISIQQLSGQITLPQASMHSFPPIAFEGQMKGAFTSLDNLSLDLDIQVLPSLNLSSGSLKAHIKDQQVDIVLDLKEFIAPLSTAKLDIAGQIKGQDHGLTLNATVREQEKELLVLEGSGHLFDAFSASLKIPAFKIDLVSHPLSQYWSAVPEELKQLAGEFSLTSRLAWNQGHLDQNHLLDINDASFAYEKILLKGIRCQLAIDDPFNLTLKPQALAIKEILTPFGALTNFKSKIAYKDETFKIDEIVAEAFTGKIRIAGALVYPLPPQQALTLEIDKIALAPLFSNLNINELTVDGRVSGKIPVSIFNDMSISIQNGDIKSIQKGSISYQWEGAQNADNSSLSMTAKALQDLRYDSVEASINKMRNKNLSLVVRLLGHNPNVLEGRSFDIKIDLSGDIVQAIQASWDAYQGEQGFWRKYK